MALKVFNIYMIDYDRERGWCWHDLKKRSWKKWPWRYSIYTWNTTTERGGMLTWSWKKFFKRNSPGGVQYMHERLQQREGDVDMMYYVWCHFDVINHKTLWQNVDVKIHMIMVYVWNHKTDHLGTFGVAIYFCILLSAKLCAHSLRPRLLNWLREINCICLFWMSVHWAFTLVMIMYMFSPRIMTKKNHLWMFHDITWLIWS